MMASLTYPPHPSALRQRAVDWLRRRVPYEADSAMFRFQARGLPEPDAVIRRTLVTLARSVGVGVALWLLWTVVIFLDLSESRTLYMAFGQFIVFLFTLSLADRLFLDFIVVLSSLNEINDDHRTGRWDSLCVTDVRAMFVFDAKHKAARLRVWHTMTWAVSLRITVLVLAGLHFLLLPLVLPGWTLIQHPLSYAAEWAEGNPLSWIGIFVGLAIAVWVCLIYALTDPYRRVNALTAASLALSARRLDGNIAIFGAVQILLDLWIGQALTAAAAILSTLVFGTVMFGAVGGGISVLFAFAVTGVLGGFYSARTMIWRRRGIERFVKLGLAP